MASLPEDRIDQLPPVKLSVDPEQRKYYVDRYGEDWANKHCIARTKPEHLVSEAMKKPPVFTASIEMTSKSPVTNNG